MSNKIDELAKEVKNTFNDYFSMVVSKNFKQFYYDWHIDNMTAPFAGLVDYFAQNYGKNAKDSFNDFTKDVIVWLETFDVDKPEIAQISMKKYSKTKDGKLKKIIDGVRTFGFECRPFIYNFATLTDHTTEFGHWPVKANMLYSCKQGLMIAKDIITFLNDNYDKIAGADNVYICENKTELQEMVSFGNKYKTLNIMPQNTVEMRAMNANFNKKFVEGYLQFNREFIASAVANNPHHINYILLNKYTWYNNEQSDTKTVMHRLNYKYDDVPHDSYRPMKRPVPTDVIKQEQNYLRLVSHALGCTKKLPYNNPYFNKRVQAAREL